MCISAIRRYQSLKGNDPTQNLSFTIWTEPSGNAVNKTTFSLTNNAYKKPITMFSFPETKTHKICINNLISK